MTEPSQYFKGRTVQEQMNEVIGYVDARAEEVAAAKADDVLQPAEDARDAAIQAKDLAVTAQDAAEDAQAAAEQAVTDAAAVLANAVKKTGEASQSIAGDIAVAGNLSGGTVTVPTPVNNTDAVNKKYVDDQDALKISISDINSYAVGLTGNQGPIAGVKIFEKPPSNAIHESGSNNQNGWRKIFVSPTFSNSNEFNLCVFKLATNAGGYGVFTAIARNGSLNNIIRRSGNYPLTSVKMSIDANNEVIIWASEYRTVAVLEMELHAGNNKVSFTDSGTISIFNEPTTADYVQVVTATE